MSTSDAPAPVLLFGRAGCHLCDDARTVVEAVCAEAGVAWAEVDLDAPGTDPALREQYGEYVPVVTVGGVQQGFWRVERAGWRVRWPGFRRRARTWDDSSRGA